MVQVISLLYQAIRSTETVNILNEHNSNSVEFGNPGLK